MRRNTGHKDRNGRAIFEGDKVQYYETWNPKLPRLKPRLIEWKVTKIYTGFNIGAQGKAEREVVDD